jgi:hypothetical protein
MKIILAILAFALLMWADAASAQKEYSLSVSRHRNVPELTTDDVNKILADASKMLQTNAGFACDVKFTLKGDVGTFPRPGSRDLPEVVDADHKDMVHAVDSEVAGVDFHIKVVEDIKPLCKPGLNAQAFQGCSWPHHFRSIIVVHPNRHKDANGNLLAERVPPLKFPDHLLWAHEFGHLTGLDHRPDPPDSRERCGPTAHEDSCALMRNRDVGLFVRDSAVPRVQISKAECDCFLSGPTSSDDKVCPQPPPRQ